jgi:hypothetical protein
MLPPMTSDKLKRRSKTILIGASLVLAGWGLTLVRDFAKEFTRLATENEQMRFADEGMQRSRTNFERPGITAEQVKWIGIISDDYGIPQDVLYALYRTERGRRGLYMGANMVDPDIRKKYPPLWWQFAKAAKTWNQHLNKMVVFDPYLRKRTIWSFARQWNPNPDEYTASVLANLELVRSNGLEVTEPPKARPSVVGSKEAEAKASKAIGAGHKRPLHSSKEKK